MLHTIRVIDEENFIRRTIHTHDYKAAIVSFNDCCRESYPCPVRVEYTADNKLIEHRNII